MAKGKYEAWLTKQGLNKIAKWARHGLTDAEIAKNMGISRSTLNDWKNKYSDISDTLKENKEKFDFEAEEALIKAALGQVLTDKSYKMVKVNSDVLHVRRKKYENEFKLNNPEATKEEMDALEERFKKLEQREGE